MTKRITTTGVKAGRVRSTSKPGSLVDPEYVAAVIGAEHVMTMPAGMSPPALMELRRELFSALKSRGGRPGLEGAELRPKIPMSAEDWSRLELVARQLGGEGFAPTAGQVGAQLLHAALVKMRDEAVPGSPRYPLASEAREPVAPYEPGPTSSHAGVQQAARKHLQQAEDALEPRAEPNLRGRRITKLPVRSLEQVFTPPGLPLVDKGARAPTTSIAVLGEAGTGKTMVAVSLARAIAADAGGLALYMTTELASTEIAFKTSLLDGNPRVVSWRHRDAARAGDLVSQHVALLQGGDQLRSVPRRRALDAAWRLVETHVSEPPIGCVVIDAFPLPEPSSPSVRDDAVALLHALEGRGVSVVIVQETAGVTDFVPFVSDVVFRLAFHEDAASGQWVRRLSCTKSRYAHARVGPHALEIEGDGAVVVHGVTPSARR